MTTKRKNYNRPPEKHIRWHYDANGDMRDANGVLLTYATGPDGKPRVVPK
jgi:hypothetical protein